jgi:hypothetical protein
MNTYDPMNGMVYRHVCGRSDPYRPPDASMPRVSPLPRDYANGSPRTYLGRTRRASLAA